MEFSPQLGYAGFNLQVQVKLEFVVTSARTQGCYSETVSVGKNASFKMTENVCGRKNLQIIRSYHAIHSTTKFSIVILLFCNPSSHRKST